MTEFFLGSVLLGLAVWFAYMSAHAGKERRIGKHLPLPYKSSGKRAE